MNDQLYRTKEEERRKTRLRVKLTRILERSQVSLEFQYRYHLQLLRSLNTEQLMMKKGELERVREIFQKLLCREKLNQEMFGLCFKVLRRF